MAGKELDIDRKALYTPEDLDKISMDAARASCQGEGSEAKEIRDIRWTLQVTHEAVVLLIDYSMGEDYKKITVGPL